MTYIQWFTCFFFHTDYYIIFPLLHYYFINELIILSYVLSSFFLVFSLLYLSFVTPLDQTIYLLLSCNITFLTSSGLVRTSNHIIITHKSWIHPKIQNCVHDTITFYNFNWLSLTPYISLRNMIEMLKRHVDFNKEGFSNTLYFPFPLLRSFHPF